MELAHEGRSTLAFIKVEEGEVTQQDVALSVAGSGQIRGRITASGRPIAGARLMIAATHPRTYNINVYNPVTDEEGDYRVNALPPGAYLVSVISIRQGKPAR